MKREKSTGDLLNELSSCSDIKEYFRKNEKEIVRDTLAERLKAIIREKGMSRSEVAVRAQVDRYYIYDIFSGRKLPGSDKLVCIVLALGLGMDETRELFRLAERPELYARDPRDSILIYAIQHQLTVDQTNAMLYEENQPLLNS